VYNFIYYLLKENVFEVLHFQIYSCYVDYNGNFTTDFTVNKILSYLLMYLLIQSCL